MIIQLIAQSSFWNILCGDESVMANGCRRSILSLIYRFSRYDTPACPTTHPSRSNRNTPKIDKLQGMNSPMNMPSAFFCITVFCGSYTSRIAHHSGAISPLHTTQITNVPVGRPRSPLPRTATCWHRTGGRS